MYKGADGRNFEIKELYYIVYRKAIRSGRSPLEAKNEAYDAVELRYSISKETTRHIMMNAIKIDSSMHRKSFFERLNRLIDLLMEVRDEAR